MHSATANERWTASEPVTQADSAAFVQAEGFLDHNDPKGDHDLLLPMLQTSRACVALQSLEDHDGADRWVCWDGGQFGRLTVGVLQP